MPLLALLESLVTYLTFAVQGLSIVLLVVAAWQHSFKHLVFAVVAFHVGAVARRFFKEMD